MYYKEEDYLQLSGIQHYDFCPRQWALIHLESQWIDNWRTTDGILMHNRVHNPLIFDKRRDLLTVRVLKIASKTLGVSGECDVVEFRKHNDGIPLFGHKEKWIPFPIEYKRGRPQGLNCDKLQLCAQAICLEEMLNCDIREGAIFYGQPKRRELVEFNNELRNQLFAITAEMHKAFRHGKTPLAIYKKACEQCSLKNNCLPKIKKAQTAEKYILKRLSE